MSRLFLAALLLAACRREAPKPAAIAGVEMVDYRAAGDAFICRAPADWRALTDEQSPPGVLFFAPSSSSGRSASISIARYAGDGPVKTPEDFRAALQADDQNPSALEPRAQNGKTVYALHYDVAGHSLHAAKPKDRLRADAVLIPFGGGFYLISHAAPIATYRETLPVFDAVVESFQPATGGLIK